MLDLNAEEIEQRLQRPFSHIEFAALVALLFLQWGFIYLRSLYGEQIGTYDLNVFYRASEGDYTGFYYPEWTLAPFYILNQLPGVMGDLIWGTVNVLCLWLAARVFSGRPTMVLFTYQALYTAYLGQVSGITLAGLALLWWGMSRERWYLAGFGGLLAATKFQIAGTFGLAIWLLTDVHWSDRVKVLILPTAIAVLSVIVRPEWIPNLIDRLQNAGPNAEGSVSLWEFVGPAALLLWVPVLWLKMPFGKRLVLVGLCAALATPYFQQNDLVHLWALPVGYLPMIGNIGFLFVTVQYIVFDVLAAILFVFYLYVLSTNYRNQQIPHEAPISL